MSPTFLRKVGRDMCQSTFLKEGEVDTCLSAGDTLQMAPPQRRQASLFL